jgi:hypothetical protein
MHSPTEMELHDEAVKVTWCACESCCSVGPRAMTIVRHHHEYPVHLNSDCCSLGLEDEIVSGEAEYVPRHSPVKSHAVFF